MVNSMFKEQTGGGDICGGDVKGVWSEMRSHTENCLVPPVVHIGKVDRGI